HRDRLRVGAHPLVLEQEPARRRLAAGAGAAVVATRGAQVGDRRLRAVSRRRGTRVLLADGAGRERRGWPPRRPHGRRRGGAGRAAAPPPRASPGAQGRVPGRLARVALRGRRARAGGAAAGAAGGRWISGQFVACHGVRGPGPRLLDRSRAERPRRRSALHAPRAALGRRHVPAALGALPRPGGGLQPDAPGRLRLRVHPPLAARRDRRRWSGGDRRRQRRGRRSGLIALVDQPARSRRTGTSTLCWTRLAVTPRKRSARKRWPWVLIATRSQPFSRTQRTISLTGSP